MPIRARPFNTNCSCSTVLVWLGILPPGSRINRRMAKFGAIGSPIRTCFHALTPILTFAVGMSSIFLIYIYGSLSRRSLFWGLGFMPGRAILRLRRQHFAHLLRQHLQSERLLDKAGALMLQDFMLLRAQRVTTGYQHRDFRVDRFQPLQ